MRRGERAARRADAQNQRQRRLYNGRAASELRREQRYEHAAEKLRQNRAFPVSKGKRRVCAQKACGKYKQNVPQPERRLAQRQERMQKITAGKAYKKALRALRIAGGRRRMRGQRKN